MQDTCIKFGCIKKEKSMGFQKCESWNFYHWNFMIILYFKKRCFDLQNWIHPRHLYVDCFCMVICYIWQNCFTDIIDRDICTYYMHITFRPLCHAMSILYWGILRRIWVLFWKPLLMHIVTTTIFTYFRYKIYHIMALQQPHSAIQCKLFCTSFGVLCKFVNFKFYLLVSQTLIPKLVVLV